jgi:hypothetical protein
MGKSTARREADLARREADLERREADVVARDAALAERTHAAPEILAAADERDATADTRDAAADKRAKALHLAELLAPSDEHGYGDNWPERRNPVLIASTRKMTGRHPMTIGSL